MSASHSILIVEDEPLIAMMLEDFLESLGHEVAGSCDNVEEAMVAVERGGFDVAILDNEILHRSHPPGGNFQGIDCNFCDRFRIEGNYLHDVNAPTSQPSSSYDRGACIQVKTQSTGTIIARNRIAPPHRHRRR